MNTKGGEGGGQIKESALIEALRENWNHARHQENQRMHTLYIHGGIIAAVISILYYVGWNSFMGIAALGFLVFFTSVVYSAIVKWNIEFDNYMAAVKWTSKELGLIKEMDNKEKEEVKRVLGEADIPEYAFINEAYMGLPLPLFIRVHRVLELYYSIVIASLVSVIVIAAGFSRFPSIFAINHPKLVIVFIITFIITFIVLWRGRRRMKFDARTFKEMREPVKKQKNREGRLRKNEI